jgi:hypothetical protein
MNTLHPRSMYTLPRGGVQRGGTPSAGSRGAIPLDGGFGGKQARDGGLGVVSPYGGLGENPPKEKIPCKCIF